MFLYLDTVLVSFSLTFVKPSLYSCFLITFQELVQVSVPIFNMHCHFNFYIFFYNDLVGHLSHLSQLLLFFLFNILFELVLSNEICT